jgi:hypothetical protein
MLIVLVRQRHEIKGAYYCDIGYSKTKMTFSCSLITYSLIRYKMYQILTDFTHIYIARDKRSAGIEYSGPARVFAK